MRGRIEAFMTHVITNPCIDNKDGSCLQVCPVDCIYEADRMFVIHPEECIDCGACISECPVEAIYTDQDLPTESAGFAAVNAALVSGVEAVDDVVALLTNGIQG
jgi:NAD-dependent dihydropyrimidine dehydrogenase PreA subunit